MGKNYKIADAVKIIEVDRDRLFYWIKHKRLITPEIQGRGRGARSRLSLLNIFELSIIKRLSDLGIELNLIEELLKKTITKTTILLNKNKKYTFKDFSDFARFVFDIYKNVGKGTNYICLIYKGVKNEYEFLPIVDPGRKGLEDFLKGTNFAVIAINLFDILRELEGKIGDEI